MLEDFLPLVSKPGRYIDNEINAIHKDHSQVRTRVCLFFPDTYEVGMSHLGLRILYHILNGRPDTVCERVFSPWLDYESRLRAANRPLRSLESNTAVAAFDILGITLQSELSYANILNGLELARIPLHAKDRSEGHPVVIAGGPCAVNPEPLSPFMDVFFIGEAEEALHEIVELRQLHTGRDSFLRALAQREGFFVPSLGRKIVRRRIVKELELAPYPDTPILPLLKPIHDRVTVEVARGCIRGCRFCQAGIIYRPYRERSPELVKSLISRSLRCTGYEELSLASLSSGDYSQIQPLMRDLVDTLKNDRISLSLPSLRIGTLTPDMVRAVAGVRKTGFTLAPEAGTERLRRVINKPVADQDLMDAARTIFENGWNVLKLYFMIGLPTETEKDLDGIISLAHNLLALGKDASKRHVQINITVSTFVPKPHTPFQWLGQATREAVRSKHAYLLKRLAKRGITLKVHNAETSLLEGVFARGDGKIGRVIEEAVRLGCRFDGWSECFDFSKWEQAFRACGLDPETYACRTLGLDEALPWDHVKSGVTKEFLKREFRRAQNSQITENCRTHCEVCGIGCPEGGAATLGKPVSPNQELIKELEADRQLRRSLHHNLPLRIRMKFSKTDRMRFLSHLDLMTVFQRAAVRAGIPLGFSQGFNPHPRIAFGPALPVGVESTSEYLDMETESPVDPLSITLALNGVLPPGIRILESRVIPSKTPSLSGSIVRYIYEVSVPPSQEATVETQVTTFLSRPSVIVSREGREKDIRRCIESIVVRTQPGPATIQITLMDQEQLKPRIQDVVAQLFGIEAEQIQALDIKRTDMFYSNRGLWSRPTDVV